MIATTQDLYVHHEKAIKVVLSCKNLEHLECARRFCMNLLEMHSKSAFSGPHRDRVKHLKMIEESESLMNEAIKDKSYKLRGESKTKYDFKSKEEN